jgi:anti-sigma B factor antagonist
MALEVTIDQVDDKTVVVLLRGPLTLGTSLKILDSQMQEMIEGGTKKLVLDLTECGYLDSAGLGVLVHSVGLASKEGGSIRFCGVNQRIANLFKMTRTDQFLPCDADRTASLAAFR